MGRSSSPTRYTWPTPDLGPTQPPSQWVKGDLSMGVKRLVRKTDRSPPTSVEGQ
jgi:hypothetical protein